MSKKNDLFAAPIGEGALILLIAAAGWITRTPLVFTSIGPTVYEVIEKPHSKSANTYNIIVGHLIGLAAGFFSVWVLNAWSSPKVASAGFIAAARMWATVIAVTLTTLLTLAAKASQPASLSTTLLVSLGSMQTFRDAVAIAAAVTIIAIIGQPIRRRRLKAMQEREPEGTTT